MQKSSFITLSFMTASLLFLSACSSDSADEVVDSAYYITPLHVYDKQASLGESDVEVLGDLRQVAQSPLHTGVDTINLEMNYDSQDASDNLDSFGSWRHSYSQSMDQYSKVDYEALDVKSPKYSAKEDVCLSGFDEIKDRAYSASLAEATSTYDAVNDTCTIRDKNGELLLTLPIFSSSGEQLFHTFTRADGETLVFVPTVEGGFESTTDKRVHLTQKGSEWELVNSDDSIETYGEDGQLLSVRSQGLALTFTYDSAHKLTNIEDAFGEEVLFDYDEAGFISSIYNSKDTIVNHFEIEAGQLKEVYLSKDGEKLELFRATYEEEGRLSRLSYPERDVSFSYKYNDEGQVTHKTTTDADGTVLDENAYTYRSDGMTVRDAKNNTTEITFKMMDSSIKPLSILNSVDTESDKVSLSYGTDGFLEKIENSDFVMTLEHNDRGLITSIVSDNNLSIDFDYDGVHNRPTQIMQDGKIQTIVYNEFGSIVTSLKETYDAYISRAPERSSGLMTHYAYDDNGRLLSLQSGSGVQRTASFSSAVSDLKPSVLDDSYETVLSSWNTDFNEAKPHSEMYYKGSNVKYYDWVAVDQPKFEDTLQDKKYIFIGYSYGADSVLELSTRDLSATPNLEVDLTITIDPVGWIPTLDPKTKAWINVTAETAVKTLEGGYFKYVGRRWGIPQFKWVKTVKSVPQLDASDLLASAGGKQTYLPLINGAGYAHEQINYTGHHISFNCMLAEVSNRHPEIGLFKVTVDDVRTDKVIENCNMGSGSITLVD